MAAATVEAQIEKQLREKYPDAASVEFQGRSTVLLDGKELFYKVGTGGARADIELLEYEAEGLRRLADAAGDSIVVPRPYLVGTVYPALGGGSGFIVMESISMSGRRDAESQRKFGKGLARLHSAPPPADWAPDRFGFPLDGCCGALAQPNSPDLGCTDWVEFWAAHRLGFQLSQCKSNARVQELGQRLLPKLGQLFRGLEDLKPSLLHGDLWSGNHAVTADGRPCMFDPAAYYGHSEADFGIARMFGGLSRDFYDAYFVERPLRPGAEADGFEQRQLLYELHHHLNHMNIFGGSYQNGALQLMNQLLRELE